MNKKNILILLTVFVLVFSLFLILNTNQKNTSVMSLSDGIKVTAPIQFTASENITAVDFKVSGNVISVDCIQGDFEVISKTNDGCVLANFNGGGESGTLGSVTFIEMNNTKPIITGILANIKGDNAKDAKIYIEY